MNTFEKPETVKPAAIQRIYTIKMEYLTVTMPAKSVVVLELIK